MRNDLLLCDTTPENPWRHKCKYSKADPPASHHLGLSFSDILVTGDGKGPRAGRVLPPNKGRAEGLLRDTAPWAGGQRVAPGRPGLGLGLGRAPARCSTATFKVKGIPSLPLYVKPQENRRHLVANSNFLFYFIFARGKMKKTSESHA
jgi:hypothetical protein